MRRAIALAACSLAACSLAACSRREPITSCDDDLRAVYRAEPGRTEPWMVIDRGATLEAYALFPDGEVSGGIGGLVHEILATLLGHARAQAIRDRILAEDVSQALHFAQIGRGEDHMSPFRSQLLYFFHQSRDGTVEARGGLGSERDVFVRFGFRAEAQFFQAGARARANDFLQLIGIKEDVLRRYQRTDTAAVMHRGDFLPPVLGSSANIARFVEQNEGIGEEIKKRVSSGCAAFF